MNKKVLNKLRDIAKKLPLTYVKGKKYMLHDIKDIRGKEIKNSQLSKRHFRKKEKRAYMNISDGLTKITNASIQNMKQN